MADNNGGGGEDLVMINGDEMADDQLLADDDDVVFDFVGGDQEVPRDVRRVRIDESIDTIPEGLFCMFEELIDLEGHDKLKRIEAEAFDGCHSLRRMSNMRCVRQIDENAFFGCRALSDLEFRKLVIIGCSSFAFCDSLRSVNMPSVRRVEGCAFQGCTALTGAVFGKDLEEIEGSAFHECTALRRIVIPLKHDLIIYWNAFNKCENLSRVDTLVGGIHNTISSLHMKSWRDELNAEIDSINQILPGISANDKGEAIRQWMRSLFQKIEHYKTEHHIVLKEAMTLLELALWKAKLEENEFTGVTSQDEGVRVTRGRRKRARKERCVTSGAGIIIKNVLPFLELK